MSLTQADQLAAVGTKSGPLGPSDDLRGLQKGHFGPKRARYKAKLCGYHEFDQTVAVGTKSGTPGPSEDLRGPQKGILWPKWALFASF